MHIAYASLTHLFSTMSVSDIDISTVCFCPFCSLHSSGPNMMGPFVCMELDAWQLTVKWACFFIKLDHRNLLSNRLISLHEIKIHRNLLMKWTICSYGIGKHMKQSIERDLFGDMKLEYIGSNWFTWTYLFDWNWNTYEIGSHMDLFVWRELFILK